MLSPEDLARDGYETVAVAAPDVHGRLFERRFLEDPGAGVSVCTAALS